MADFKVHALDVLREAGWSFETSQPRWGYATFDPFPAYPHDLTIVQDTVDHVVDRCPPLWDVGLHVADRECVSRSNGLL